METFSTGSCIRFGWETFKKRPWFFIGMTLLVLVLLALVKPGQVHSLPGALVFLVCVALSVLIDIGLTSLYLKAHDVPDSLKASDLWHPQQYWNYLLAVIFSGVLIGMGFILLIVPGVMLLLMWMFVKFVVVDRHLGPIEAMKESARITEGHRWDLLVFLLAIIGIVILGAVCLLIGLLVAIPVVALATVHAYRILSKMAGEHTPAAA